MTKYEIKDGKLVRSNPFCPRCGSGVSLANKGDWWSCGKCGTRWTKDSFGKQSASETCMHALKSDRGERAT